MRIKIVGKRNVQFQDQRTGNTVSGTTYVYLYEDQNVDGFGADKVFVRDGYRSPFTVGNEYDVYFTRHGKIDLDNVQSR